MTGSDDDSTLTPLVARDLLSTLAGRWPALVVAQLHDRPHRFGELRRAVDGISHRMLSVTLRTLEREGVVDRTVYPTVPPQVEYALTDLGNTLVAVIYPVVVWMHEHRDDVAVARARYDERSTAGERSTAADAGPDRTRPR
ncbi:winged helix-turn-helix transcriptional regulator [Nocardia sp. NPDC052566]|uniref:winged helix-turn-helix transcriptional regulator n=1 Tax=Nocardia sp. NPDC052566 TaxID=3364330 RepID=UPI0037C8EF7C